MRRVLALLLLALAPHAFADSSNLTAAVCAATGRTTTGTVDCSNANINALDFFVGFSSYATADQTFTSNNGTTISLVARDGATTEQVSVTRFGVNGQASDIQCSGNDDDKAFITLSNSNSCASPVDVASVSAFPSDQGVTYNYTTASGRAELLKGIGLGCASCEADILTYTFPSGSAAAVAQTHTLAAAPTFLILLGQETAADGTANTTGRGFIGLFDGTNYFGYYNRNNGGGVGNAATNIWSSKWPVSTNPDYVTVTMNSTSVTLTPTASFGNTTTVKVMAVYGPSLRAQVGNFATPTSTGSVNSITSLPWTPQAVLFVPTRMTSMNGSSTSDTAGVWGIGAVATTGGITQASVASSIDDNLSPSEDKDYTDGSNAVVIPNIGSAIYTKGAVTAITSSVTVNYTTAGSPAVYVGYLAINQDAVSDDALDATIPYTDVTGQQRSSTITSAAITIIGINTAAAISVSGDAGCQWEKNGSGTWSSSPGTVSVNDTVKLRVTSSASINTATNCTSTIGTGGFASDQFRVTTGDDSPTSFAAGFTDVTNQALSATVTSNCLTIGGIDMATTVTSSGGLVNIAGGAYSASPGQITNGQQFCARLTTSGSPNTAVNDVVTVGDQNDTYTATTAVAGVDSAVQRMLLDTFTEGGGDVSITAHTPDSNPAGNAWTLGNGAATVVAATDILSLGASSIAVIDLGISDVMVSATWSTGTPADSFNLITRYTSTSSYYRCRITPSVNRMVLQKVSPSTGVSDLNFVTQTFSASTDYRIVMYSVGTQHVCATATAAAPTTYLSTIAASDSELSATKHGLGGGTSAQTADALSIMRAYSATLSDTQAPADDDLGFFNGDTVAVGSIYAASPTNLLTQHTCTLYDGGSGSCVEAVGFVGTDDFVWELYSASANTIQNGTVTIQTNDTATPTAPVWGTIPDQTCALNTDPGPVDLTQYLTTAGQPTPTYTLSAGSLPTGRTLSTGGVITGPCQAAGTFSPTIQASNATGSPTKAFSYTVTVDTTPDIPPFTPSTGVNISTLTSSSYVTVTGLGGACTITVAGDSGCKWDKNSAASYSSSSGSISNNDTLSVQVTSSGSISTTTQCTATCGGVSQRYDVTTSPTAPPTGFAFTALNSVALNTTQTSETITIAGATGTQSVSVTGGTYSKNGAAYTSSGGTAVNGDEFSVRHTSSSSNNTAVNTVLVVGGTSGTFTSTTLLGSAPVCSDIPNQYVDANVQITPISLSAYCPGATTANDSGTHPTGISRAGVVISGKPTTAGHTITQYTVTNQYGSDTVGVTWEVRDPTLTPCNQNVTTGTVVTTPITTPFCNAVSR